MSTSHSTNPATDRPADGKVHRDRRLWKGSAVGIAAIGLLVGGGTFALWYDQADLSGADITSGQLTIDADPLQAVWTNADGSIDPDTYLVVPGDVLTLAQPVDVTAIGDQLEATLTVDTTGLTGDAALAAALDVDFALDTPPAGVVADGSGGYTLTGALGAATLAAVVTITFPETIDGLAPAPDRSNYWNLTAQNESIQLSSAKFDLVQVAP